MLARAFDPVLFFSLLSSAIHCCSNRDRHGLLRHLGWDQKGPPATHPPTPENQMNTEAENFHYFLSNQKYKDLA